MVYASCQFGQCETVGYNQPSAAEVFRGHGAFQRLQQRSTLEVPLMAATSNCGAPDKISEPERCGHSA